jgi:hypothetical protein
VERPLYFAFFTLNIPIPKNKVRSRVTFFAPPESAETCPD